MPHHPDFYVQTPTYPTPGDGLERPPGLINRNASPNFQYVCQFFQNLKNLPKRKAEQIAQFIAIWRKNVGPDVYPFMRLLLPDRDRDRPVYGLKEQAIAKCYVEVLGLDRHSDAAQRLMKWKQPRPGEESAGDFPTVCYDAIVSRRSVKEKDDLTVDAVNGLLDDLTRYRSQKQQTTVFRKIMHHCTPEQQRWIIRIILKDLRIGVREKSVLGLFHPDAVELFNVSSDLKRVCWTLADPKYRLPKNEAEVTLFRSFLPQLCKRTASHDLGGIVKLMKTKPFYIEEKLDGERIQLHKRGNEYFYCSRKAKDYSYLYGSSPEDGTLTPFIHNTFGKTVKNCILDGEMLVWDPLLQKYLAFGSLKTAALDKSQSEDAPRPCFKVFDILMLNDKSLANVPLSTRKRVIFNHEGAQGEEHRLFEPIHGRFEIAEYWEGKTDKDIRSRLEDIMEEKGEGLVIKEPSSTYKTNGREIDWCKVKPEYADEMGENVDVLVIGGWWGSGRRGGKISSLLCGLRDQQEDDGTLRRPTFTTFTKVGGGMSIADYTWIEEKHRKHWIPFDKSKPPAWMTVGPLGNDDKPDVYIEPENSFVIEVKASEFIRAEGNFGFSHCLRFPRCKYIRWDEGSRPAFSQSQQSEEDENRKVWNMWTCMSVQDVKDLIEEIGGKRKYQDEGPQQRKKRMTTSRSAKIASAFAGQRIDIEAETRIFKGVKFFIIKGNKDFNQQQLERLVVQHGGDFCQMQLADGSAMVISSSDKIQRAAAQIKKGKDIVKPEWILESIKHGRMLPLTKELTLHATEETKSGEYYSLPLSPVKSQGIDDDLTEDEDEGHDEESIDPLPSAQPQNAIRLSLGDGWDMRLEKTERDDDETEEEGSVAASVENEASNPLPSGDSSIIGSKQDDRPRTPSPVQPSSLRETLSQSVPPTQVSTKDTDEMSDQGPMTGGKPETDRKMGDDDDVNEYGEDKIFTNLLFYIDTDENAALNGLTRSQPAISIQKELQRTTKTILSNGGKITTDPSESKITHIIQSEDDDGRYREIIRKYSKPYKKHVVSSGWVDDSVESGTLLAEGAYGR